MDEDHSTRSAHAGQPTEVCVRRQVCPGCLFWSLRQLSSLVYLEFRQPTVCYEEVRVSTFCALLPACFAPKLSELCKNRRFLSASSGVLQSVASVLVSRGCLRMKLQETYS